MHILTLDQVRQVAPAAFSVLPSSEVSDRYAHVNTAEVLEVLLKDGWQINSAAQGRTLSDASHNIRACRAASVTETGLHRSHEVRLSHPTIPEIRGCRPQLIAGNSSDRSSAFAFYAGAFRDFCFNGLVVGESVVGLKVHHRGSNLLDRVLEQATTIRSQFGKVTEAIDVWSQRTLNDVEARTLAFDAIALRFPGEDVRVPVEGLLRSRRWADDHRDLWTVFNRVQENVIKGGFRVGRRTVAVGPIDRYGSEFDFRRSRAVTGITQARTLNRELWDLAASYAN